MFGYRPDGRPVPEYVDPIVQFTPFIMTTRNDAQNFVTFPVEYKPMADYIRAHRDAEEPISFMTILIAAYVRAVRKHPELNRFVVGKRLYAHKGISISYMVLRETSDGRLDEAAIKLHLEPTDTIFDVARKLNERRFLKIPIIPWLLVSFIKLLDRFGLMPGKIIEVSPFHCSLFVTNMMSINLPSIYHHLYNFGTCSLFLALGRPERQVIANKEGKAVRQLMVPVGAVTDERVCGGASYAVAMRTLLKYMLDPAALETLEEEQPEA